MCSSLQRGELLSERCVCVYLAGSRTLKLPAVFISWTCVCFVYTFCVHSQTYTQITRKHTHSLSLSKDTHTHTHALQRYIDRHTPSPHTLRVSLMDRADSSASSKEVNKAAFIHRGQRHHHGNKTNVFNLGRMSGCPLGESLPLPPLSLSLSLPLFVLYGVNASQ